LFNLPRILTVALPPPSDIDRLQLSVHRRSRNTCLKPTVAHIRAAIAQNLEPIEFLAYCVAAVNEPSRVCVAG
jgi:hypothetical protein